MHLHLYLFYFNAANCEVADFEIFFVSPEDVVAYVEVKTENIVKIHDVADFEIDFLF